MRVIWTRQARLHLDAIREYLEGTSPGLATAVVARTLFRIGQLTEFPRPGPVVGSAEEFEMRSLVEGQYRIFYVLSEDEVVIIGVLPGRRNVFGAS